MRTQVQICSTRLSIKVAFEFSSSERDPADEEKANLNGNLYFKFSFQVFYLESSFRIFISNHFILKSPQSVLASKLYTIQISLLRSLIRSE